ncbi:MAG: hypothetical protein S4CHLAM81_14520 [Chlamydiales bacterium]|nr:hypothetical protein [Chlamydiales bacterium]MCH9636224.1 hypothetical protein [Chlamydiales bacterium]MCH9703791.1 ankyrin repeat domain-containing protein [Chlamydiota bacterium]
MDRIEGSQKVAWSVLGAGALASVVTLVALGALGRLQAPVAYSPASAAVLLGSVAIWQASKKREEADESDPQPEVANEPVVGLDESDLEPDAEEEAAAAAQPEAVLEPQLPEAAPEPQLPEAAPEPQPHAADTQPEIPNPPPLPPSLYSPPSPITRPAQQPENVNQPTAVRTATRVTETVVGVQALGDQQAQLEGASAQLEEKTKELEALNAQFKAEQAAKRTASYHQQFSELLDDLFIPEETKPEILRDHVKTTSLDLKAKAFENDQTALHLLAAHGRFVDYVAEIADQVDFDAQDTSGQTPLMVAIAAGHHEMALKMIELKKGKLKLKSTAGVNALHLLVAKGDEGSQPPNFPCLQLVKAMVKMCPELRDEKTTAGYTALDFAILRRNNQLALELKTAASSKKRLQGLYKQRYGAAKVILTAVIDRRSQAQKAADVARSTRAGSWLESFAGTDEWAQNSSKVGRWIQAHGGKPHS